AHQAGVQSEVGGQPQRLLIAQEQRHPAQLALYAGPTSGAERTEGLSVDGDWAPEPAGQANDPQVVGEAAGARLVLQQPAAAGYDDVRGGERAEQAPGAVARQQPVLGLCRFRVAREHEWGVAAFPQGPGEPGEDSLVTEVAETVVA